MTIQTIISYIIEKYPKSCLAVNLMKPRSGIKPTAEEVVKFFYTERLEWCTCGDPQVACDCIKNYLSALNIKTGDRQSDMDTRHAALKEHFGVEWVYDNPLLLCLAYTLDTAKFTEHGTGIGGAWLTDEGKMFLYALEEAQNTWDDEYE